MSEKKYTATTSDSDREVTVTYDFGDTLDEAVERFGPDVVFSRFQSAAVIDLQSLIRRGIKAQKNDNEIQQMAANWKPGIKQVVAKDPKSRALQALQGLDPEQRKALLEEFASSLGEESDD